MIEPLIQLINYIIDQQPHQPCTLNNHTVKVKLKDMNLVLYFIFKDHIFVAGSCADPISVSIECSLSSLLLNSKNADTTVQGDMEVAKNFDAWIKSLSPITIPLPSSVPNELHYLWEKIQNTLCKHLCYAINANKDLLPSESSLKSMAHTLENWVQDVSSFFSPKDKA